MTRPDEKEEVSPLIGEMADNLNVHWKRFEATLISFRTPAQVPIPGHDGLNLRWCRFGGEWTLIVGDERGGRDVVNAHLDVRIDAAAVALHLRDALTLAQSQKGKDILAAMNQLTRATEAKP